MCNVQIVHPRVIVRPSLVLSPVKLPPSLSFMKCSPFSRKCGEMQMFKGCWRQWWSAGRPLCPAQVGHDSYLLWQRPVSAHTEAHKSIHAHTHRAANVLSLSLVLLPVSLIYTYYMTKSRMMLGNWVPSESNKGTGDTSTLERINYH